MSDLGRRLVRDVGIYGIGDFLVKASAVLTLPIYTRLFPPDEFGAYSLILTGVGLISAILILGGDSAYARFFFAESEGVDRRVLTTTWLGFLAIWAGALSAALFLARGELARLSFGSPDLGVAIGLAVAGAPISLMNNMLGQVLRNRFQSGLFISLNLLSTLLTIGLSVYAVIVLRLGITGMLLGTLAGALLVLPIRFYVVREMFAPVFSAALLGRILRYSVPLVPASLAYWVFISSDRFMLGKLSTLDELGLYTVAVTVAGVMSFVNGAIGQAWSVHAVRIYEERRGDAPELFGRMLTYLTAGFGLLCVGLSAFAGEAIALLSAPAFAAAAAAVGPLALGMVAMASTQVTALGMTLRNRTVFVLAGSWIAALINLGLNVLLIPKWGMLGASWSTAIAYWCLTLSYLGFSQRLLPLRLALPALLSTVGLTVAFTVGTAALPTGPVYLSLLLRGLFCLAYVALLFAFRVLSWDDLTTARRLLGLLDAPLDGESPRKG